MASNDKLVARMKAIESLSRLYAVAEECKALHRKAGLPLPKELALLAAWGEDETKAEEQQSKRALLTIPPPVPPMEKGWLSIPFANGMPITIIPAVLRDSSEAVPVADLRQTLRSLGVSASEGSIDNIGTKLDKAQIIWRSAAGWRLREPNRAAIVSGGRLHGPPEVFQPPELAAHRREAGLAYFEQYGTLSRSQLIRLLQDSDWVVATINLFLVKADLAALQSEKRIRRSKPDDPRNWDWELAKKKGQLRLANVNTA